MSFAREVWDRLSKVDVSNHIEKKMNISYLSWAWAWGVLMDNYPESQYDLSEPVIMPDNSVEVRVCLTIKDGEQSLQRVMWLPVMDHKNKAIINPSSRDVSDARMRCLVKAIAMFGLGHYIYAGEDLPCESKAVSAADKAKAEKKVIDNALRQIEDCKSLAQLQNVWNAIPRHLKPECEAKKNMAKQLLTEGAE